MTRSRNWFNEGYLTKRVHWLRGGPGYGKTALLWMIAKTCLSAPGSQASGQPWIANISFDGGCTLERFVSNFIITVLAQFAKIRPPLGATMEGLCQKLQLEVHDSGETRPITEMPVSEQIEDLFLPSIRPSVTHGSPAPMVIILDGVDKCEDGALRELWGFIERITSPDLAHLPFYFLLSGSNTKKVRDGLEKSPLRERVDANDVDDHRVVQNELMEHQQKTELLNALVKNLKEDSPDS